MPTECATVIWARTPLLRSRAPSSAPLHCRGATCELWSAAHDPPAMPAPVCDSARPHHEPEKGPPVWRSVCVEGWGQRRGSAGRAARAARLADPCCCSEAPHDGRRATSGRCCPQRRSGVRVGQGGPAVALGVAVREVSWRVPILVDRGRCWRFACLLPTRFSSRVYGPRAVPIIAVIAMTEGPGYSDDGGDSKFRDSTNEDIRELRIALYSQG